MDEQKVVESSGPEGPSSIGLIIAVEEFKKEFRNRSFSGRNAQLGKMINCAVCDLRHRESQCHKTQQTFAKDADGSERVSDSKRIRPVGNPFWRSKPGTFRFIPELKKFVRIVS